MDDYITVYLSRVNTDPSGALRSELGATEREKTAEIVCYFTVKKKKKKVDFFHSDCVRKNNSLFKKSIECSSLPVLAASGLF